MAYAAWSDLVMTARRTGEPLPTISGTLTTARPDRDTRDAAIDIATGRFGDPRPAPVPRNGRPEHQHHAGTSPAPAQETASRQTGALLAPDARTPAGRDHHDHAQRRSLAASGGTAGSVRPARHPRFLDPGPAAGSSAQRHLDPRL